MPLKAALCDEATTAGKDSVPGASALVQRSSQGHVGYTRRAPHKPFNFVGQMIHFGTRLTVSPALAPTDNSPSAAAFLSVLCASQGRVRCLTDAFEGAPVGGDEARRNLGAHCQTAQLTHPIGVTLAIPYKFDDDPGDHSGGQIISTDQEPQKCLLGHRGPPVERPPLIFAEQGKSVCRVMNVSPRFFARHKRRPGTCRLAAA
jgi:hypothetical protein